MSEQQNQGNVLHDAISELAKAAGSIVGGAGVGYGAVAATGMTAAGMVGGGAGFGMVAGPVGAAAGAVVGLAMYGIYRAICQ